MNVLRDKHKSQDVETFLRHTYFSVAETLPHRSDFGGSTQGTLTLEDQAKLVQAILDSACVNPLEQATRRIPRTWAIRHLPPGKLADLYMMFSAWARGRGLCPASAWTFRKVWKSEGWNKCLTFRKESTHALCFTCGQLRHRIHRAETVDEHINACGMLHAHLRDQYRDREIYWSIRARARSERDVLSLIMDGMDHSKFGIPQWADGRMPKHTIVDKNTRPCCSLYGVIAHGWRVDLYISHEGVAGGSPFCADMMFRTLDQIWRQSQRSGRPFPLDCVVQGDNTSKEVKNSIMGRVLALLSLHGTFRAAAHMHLRVGHTHEDIDQLFGFVARSAWPALSTDSR